MKTSIKLTGDAELIARLRRYSTVRFQAVTLKNLTEIFNRAESATPVDTGELRQARRVEKPRDDFDGCFGYTKEYAPHVEYGHRTLSGGFVPGQHFLQDNVNAQVPIFKRDLENELRKVK